MRAAEALLEPVSIRSIDDSPQRQLQRLLAKLESRVPGSRGHARRVSFYAALTAMRMGLDREEVARVRRAALVHDVGKVETPAEILNHPGPLGEEEYRLVRRHALVGARMVSCLGDEGLTAIVRHHHERLDGSGYPDRLRGERIPIGARVVAVADTFDALTSRRCYRPAMEYRQALELLDAEAGVRLDADVVATFREHCGAFNPRRPAAGAPGSSARR